MATINLGAIKFNWRGAYNNATAYAVDDVVSSGGSSYICILASTGNAVSNGTYWQQMSAAGTNGTDGTDLTTTLTTQGDIVYRDGSGLQRLGAGTSGQFLKTQGAGANPIWANAGGLKQFVYATDATVKTATNETYTTVVSLNITPSSTSSKIILQMQTSWGYSSGGNSPNAVIFPKRAISGGATTNLAQDAVPSGFPNVGGISATEQPTQGTEMQKSMAGQWTDEPNTTSQITYSLMYFVSDLGSHTAYIGSPGSSGTSASWHNRVVHYISAMEIGV